MECYSEKSSDSIKVGRWKKIKKKHLVGEGPRGGVLRPGSEGLQDRKAQSQRSRIFTNLPGGKGARRELGQDPRRGSGAPRFPGALTEEVRPRGKWSTHRRPKDLEPAPSRARGAAQVAAPRRGGCGGPGSPIPAAQAPEPRATGDTAQGPVLPLGKAEAGRTHDSEDAPAASQPRAMQIRASRPLRTERQQ